MLDPIRRDAYLLRLGLAELVGQRPSIDALQQIHRAHAARIPYETLWIHAGEPWGIDPTDSVTRIAQQQRGGYCYHLNGALAELLESLGYNVTRHVGGVHGPDGPSADESGNHLVLTVRELPAEVNPRGVWYVDVGLGDALHEALPLVAGTYTQGPFTLRLEETDGGIGDWHLVHDPAGGFSGMSWRTRTARWSDFTEKHVWLSTAAESGFVRIGMAQCRDATGVDVVRGLVRKRIGTNASSEPLTDRTDWFDALAELFGLRFDATPPALRDRLWTRTVEKHRAWEAEQGG